MDAGGLPVFPSANQAHPLNTNLHLQQQQQQQQRHHHQHQLQQQQQQHQQHPHPLDHLQQQGIVQDLQQYHQTDGIPTKRQAVVDRLKRRIENYRRHQTDCEPKFKKTFSGVCEQQNIETTLLQKRFLESKAAKRAAKKTDKKPDTTLAGNLQSSVLVVSTIFVTIFTLI